MGLFYSVMSYVKTFYTGQPHVQLSETTIVVSVNKLINVVKLKQMQQQAQAKSLQSNLLVAVKGELKTRSGVGEQELMEAVVRKSQLVAAYEEIIRCANIIKNQARILELDPRKISKPCEIAICTIIYAYKDLELSDCINLNQFVPQPHPVIEQSQISEALRQYVEYKGASQYALNTYIAQFCCRNTISLQTVNAAGHGFVNNPQKMQDRESKSAEMFALSIDEVEITEMQKQTGYFYKIPQ